jgi:glutathione S-transferase
VILLRAKNVDFDVTYIDLTDKPDWFLKISPHGKVPVLSVDGEPLFESNAIAEYLEDVVEPKCHPADTFKRARNRAWTDFVPDFSKGINIYYTKTREEMDEKVAGMSAFLQKLEDAIAKERDNEGPYFNGTEICLVDASYAPFLQRFLLIEQFVQTGILEKYPLVRAWAEDLLQNDAVIGSVHETFEEVFFNNLRTRGWYVGTLLGESTVAAE